MSERLLLDRLNRFHHLPYWLRAKDLYSSKTGLITDVNSCLCRFPPRFPGEIDKLDYLALQELAKVMKIVAITNNIDPRCGWRRSGGYQVSRYCDRTFPGYYFPSSVEKIISIIGAGREFPLNLIPGRSIKTKRETLDAIARQIDSCDHLVVAGNRTDRKLAQRLSNIYGRKHVYFIEFPIMTIPLATLPISRAVS